MQVPRLRNELKNHDTKNLDFNGYLRVIDEITTEVRTELEKAKLVKPLQDDIKGRPSFLMNQTFNNFSESAMAKTGLDFSPNKTGGFGT